MSRNKAIWLARLLFRRGQLTRDEILEAWSRSDENARRMAASTFYDNKHLLEERFGIRLRCESGYYSLDMHDAREQDFMKQLFRYDSGTDDDATHVYIDEPQPAGYKYVAAMAQAVEKREWTEIKYRPFDKQGYSTLFAPYCLRTFRGRCYAVGFSEHHNEIRTFALDRMEQIEVTRRTFRTDTSFSARRYFEHSFGAYGGMNLVPDHIIIEADTQAAAYLRTRPLHETQRETSAHRTGKSHAPEKEAGTYPLRFEIDVAISEDFVRELLYYGPEVRVIEPESLKRMIRRAAKDIANMYEA